MLRSQLRSILKVGAPHNGLSGYYLRSAQFPVSKLMFTSRRFESSGNPKYHGGFKNENEVDKNFYIKWLGIIVVFGTYIFAKIARRIKENQNEKSYEKNKKTYTEAEWQQHLRNLRRTRFNFESGEEFYLFPFASKNGKQVDELVEKLGGEDTVAVIDLNKLIKKELDASNSRFGDLLKRTLDKKQEDASGCHYTFTYALASGLFTRLIQDHALSMVKEHPQYSRFILLNYPNTVEEGVKFEQKVAKVTDLVVAGNEPPDNSIVEYFDTVGKVISVDKIPKMEPKIIERNSSKPGLENELNTGLASLPEDAPEPAKDASTILKAQYRLRQLGQPIRKYGEKDKDVIQRLSSLLKNDK